MIAFLTKYWNRLRFTERDMDVGLRKYCIQVASAYEGKDPDNMLRLSQRVYDWINGARPPAEHHAAEIVASPVSSWGARKDP